jgi:cysteine desulfurase
MKMKSIYLDYAATTPIDNEVLSLMLPYFSDEYNNPSSLHKSGRKALKAIREAKEIISRIINVSSDEIIFTGSGTEADNIALIGTARANKEKGNHIIISAIEHKAILESAKFLEKEGFEISFLPVDKNGVVDLNEFKSLIREDTILVSVMLANNEIGTIQPVSEISKILKERRNQTGFPLIHTDACQDAGHTEIDVEKLGVDLLTLNGSKVYGPKGIGVLYKKRDVKISPIIVGGDQEKGYRAGTESVPVIMGMAFALQKSEELREKEEKRLLELRKYFISILKEKIPEIIINGHPTEVLSHIISVTMPNIEGESIVLMLDDKGVEVATGSACSAKNLKPSHVLIAIGQDDRLLHGSVRFSLGRKTTKEDLDYALSVFPEVVQRLKEISALTTKNYE